MPDPIQNPAKEYYLALPNSAMANLFIARLRTLYREDFSLEVISHISSMEQPSAIQSRIFRSSSDSTSSPRRIQCTRRCSSSFFPADISAHSRELSMQSIFPSHSIALARVSLIYTFAGFLGISTSPSLPRHSDSHFSLPVASDLPRPQHPESARLFHKYKKVLKQNHEGDTEFDFITNYYNQQDFPAYHESQNN